MGQFYDIFLYDDTSSHFETLHPADIGGGNKLTENGIDSYGMEFLCDLLHDNPLRLAWVGDYSKFDEDCEQMGLKLSLSEDEAELIFTMVRRGFNYCPKHMGALPESEPRYIINMTKKQYIDMVEYRTGFSRQEFAEWAKTEDWLKVHPLPLLTAVGNGKGGGDFYGEPKGGSELVGTWAFDKIYTSQNLPDSSEYSAFSNCFFD